MTHEDAYKKFKQYEAEWFEARESRDFHLASSLAVLVEIYRNRADKLLNTTEEAK